MSMIENLEQIRQYGIDKFLKNEEIIWTCKECGNIVYKDDYVTAFIDQVGRMGCFNV